VYAPAIANFTVSKKAFTTSITSPFDNTVTDKMGYNKVQDALIKAFKDSVTINKKALYLFFIKENTTHSDIKGHMPFNQPFGFIYAANQSITELTRTMAHELGHGAFRLKHTFSNENEFVQDQGQTPNLMDYASGSELLKYQWDECHDFDLGCNWFEDGDEGAIVSYSKKLNKDQIEAIKKSIKRLMKKSYIFSFIYKTTIDSKFIIEEYEYSIEDKTDNDGNKSNASAEVLILKSNNKNANYKVNILIDPANFTCEKELDAALYEEILHCGQAKFYGVCKPEGNLCYINENWLLYEMEAKICAALSGETNREYQIEWANNTIVKDYFDAIRNGKSISEKLKFDFQKEKEKLAIQVLFHYSMRRKFDKNNKLDNDILEKNEDYQIVKKKIFETRFFDNYLKKYKK
jgi:hypothetical protein